MASRGTASAVGQLQVIDLDLPPVGAKGRRLAHVERSGGCVHVVARPAGAPSLLLVYVNKMQAALFVAKLGDTDPLFDCHEVLNVTLETQGIRLRLERSIEEVRVWLGQQTGNLRGVRVVARRALAVLDRAMMPRVLLEQAGYISEQSTVLRAQRLAMTRKTEALFLLDEQRGQHAAVPGVARMAGFSGRQRTVNERRGLDECSDIVMVVAQVTKLRRVSPQLPGVLRGMRVMAVEAAPVHDRRMRTTDQLETGTKILVAQQAELLYLLGQELRHPRGVGFMTHVARADDHHTIVDVLHSPVVFRLVAGKAK